MTEKGRVLPIAASRSSIGICQLHETAPNQYETEDSRE